MATRGISIEQYRKLTGLKTKKEGIYYARKFGLRLSKNPRLGGRRSRIRIYLEKIKLKIEKEDEEKVLNEILKKKINPFIIRANEGIFTPVSIYLEDYILRKVKYKIDGKEYIRNSFFERFSSRMIQEMVKNLTDIGDRRAIIMVKKVYIDKDENNEPIAKIEKSYYTKKGIIGAISDGYYDDEFYGGELAPEAVVEIKISYPEPRKAKRKLEGGFFPYYLSSRMDCEHMKKLLARYQIFTEEDIEEANKDKENCLVRSLLNLGVESDKLTKLRLECKHGNIPMTHIRDFAEKNNYRISIHNDKKTYYYGKLDDNKLELCLYKDHYFPYENVDVMAYALKNYKQLKNEKKWWTITGSTKKGDKIYYKRDKKYNNNSFSLIKTLFENNYFRPIKICDSSIKLYDYKKLDQNLFKLSDPSEDEVKEMSCKYGSYKESRNFPNNDKTQSEIYKSFEKLKEDNKKNLKDDKWIFKKFFDMVKNSDESIFLRKKEIRICFDFETSTKGITHIPYMVSSMIVGDDVKDIICSMDTFIGEDCAEKFLNSTTKCISRYLVNNYGLPMYTTKTKEEKQLKKKILNIFFNFVMYAHNITYDMQFLIKHIYHYNPVFRAGNKICGGSFNYFGFSFKIKDTYAIVDCSLAMFNNNFNLGKDMKKEVMPYDIYTIDSVNKSIFPISEALKKLKNDEDRETFIKNITELKLIVADTYFNHMNYARYYCERDVQVMMEGYFVFRGWIRDQLDVDIDNFLTVSSISDEYFKKEKCYKGCYTISGIPRFFIQNTVVGGRCMSSNNEMFNITVRLNDFDGVSLYPSAMRRLGDIGGYLKGTPKVLSNEQLNMNFLNSVDGYFIRIKLLRIRKKRDFPLVSVINKEGVRMFTNEVNEDNNIIFMNKISLEDVIKYHELKERDFEIIDGYYFNEGRNNKIGTVIQNVFDLRAKYKAEKNPIETLYKLVMNSAYGKTILNPNDINYIYCENKETANDYMLRNYNNVIHMEKLHECSKRLIKTRKPLYNHFNACHIGSEILAMSKRIMNEVMCTAEDMGINIYYQDTDSMHIENDKIDLLAEEFKKKYGRDLIGKKLGQFHNDFAEKRKVFKIDDEKVKYKNTKSKDKDDEYKELNLVYKPVSTVKTVILGKKAYLDVVKYKYDEEDTFKYLNIEEKEKNTLIKKVNNYLVKNKTKEREFTHFRMKGIPQDVVKYYTKEEFEGDKYKLYDYLFNGNEFTFDLLKSKKPKFEIGHGIVSTRTDFHRKLTFGEDKNKKDKKKEEEYEEDEPEEVFNDIND